MTMTSRRRLLLKGSWWHKEDVMIMNYEDSKERYFAAVERYKLGEINTYTFQTILASLGYNATEIQAEVDQVKREV